MTIADYIRELEKRLPPIGRRRPVAEARAHLLDSAADHERSGVGRAEAEELATRDFGDVQTVARRMSAAIAVLETRLASALTLAAVALFVFPLYVVPENTLPPAQWSEKPLGIHVLQLVSPGVWALAGGLAATGAVLAWTRWSRFTAPLLEWALRALAASIAASALLVAYWATESDVALVWPLLAAPLALACLLACAQAAGWAHSRRCRLVQD